MANILTIGVHYEPNYKIKDNTGQERFEPIVYFYFNSDNKTANLVAGSGVSKGLSVDGDSLIKKVKASVYKDFINGANVFTRIIKEFEKYGYVYDMTNNQKLIASVEQEIDNKNKAGLQKQINTDVSSFIDQLIEMMEKNMNDPKFVQYLNSVGNITHAMPSDDIDKLTDLEYSNKIMALTQWINHGRQGSPKFIATKKQFLLAGYQVNPGATPMYIMGPKSGTVQSRSVKQAVSDYGITDLDTNDKRKIDVDRLTHDKDYGHNNVKQFQLWGPCYSILDCSNMGNSNLADYIDKMENADGFSDTDTMDKDAQAKMKSDILAKFEMDNQNVLSDSSMCQNAKKYADSIGDKKLSSIANNGDAYSVIKFLVENNETYLRSSKQRYAQYSTQTKNLLEALACKVLGVNVSQADSVIASNAGSLRKNGKANKSLFYNVAAELENIYYIMKGISEARTSSDMLMFVLNSCGISPEEFRNMPNTEEEAIETLNNVRENFVRTFNKLLIKH
jgi:hypothetical protein